MRVTPRERGFTVVEAIVDVAIVTTGVLALASLAAQVTDTVVRARRQTVAAALADQALAARLRQPLAPTASDCLQHDVAGCVEALDAAGAVTAAVPAFVRRWRVVAVGGVPAVWSVGICVVPAHERGGSGAAPGACVARLAWEAAP